MSWRFISERITRSAADLEVHVRSRGLAGLTLVADHLALDHMLAGADDHARGMAVERLRTVRMLDDDVRAISAVPSALLRDDDIAACRGEYRRRLAVEGREVHAIVSMDALRLLVMSERRDVVTGIFG